MEPQTQFIPVDLNPAATEDAARRAAAQPDSFLDEQFAPLDTRGGGAFVQDLTDIANEDVPPPALPTDNVPQDPTPAQPAPPAPPDVITYDDGSTVAIEKTPKGWRATLDTGTQNPEVFYGKTKDEMWTSIAAAKMHATRHIRDLNKKIKLGTGPQPQYTAPSAPTAQPGITAEDVFEIKSLLSSDPNLALEKWFQKRTGLSPEKLTAIAQRGERADIELEMETTAKAFVASHPDYDSTPGTGNFDSMVGWISKYKLNQPLNGKDPNAMLPVLYQAGLWNAQVLDEAFNELNEDGLLQLTQADQPQPQYTAPPAVERSQPAVPTVNRPIAGRRVGQRVGLGIRAGEVAAPSPEAATRPPSADEFDNMTDAEIAKHFGDVRRYVAQSARR